MKNMEMFIQMLSLLYVLENKRKDSQFKLKQVQPITKEHTKL